MSSAWPPPDGVHLVQDDAGFARLAEGWSALDADPAVRPFQQYGWIAAWRQTLGATARLHIATQWQSGRLQAVLPFCIRRLKGLRLLEWMAADVSDYCDGLTAPGPAGEQALAALWSAVLARGGFDLARLRHVRSDARFAPVLARSSPWTETHEHAGGVSIAWTRGEDWLQSRSKKMRDNITYKQRRMSKAGFEVRILPHEASSAPYLDLLAAQKRPWLAERDLTGPICLDAGLAFMKRAAAHAAARGELHLSLVTNGTTTAAIDIGFVRAGVIYSYMASFDPAYAKYSFGRLLTDQFIMWSCDQGMRRFDLMLGAYDYKTEYGCTLEPVSTQLVGRSLLGKAAIALYRFQKRRKAPVSSDAS